MGLIEIANYYGKFKEMKKLIGQVSNEELQLKLNESFQWLMEHRDCHKINQTAVELVDRY